MQLVPPVSALAQPAAGGTEPLAPIAHRYLLVLHIPVYRDASGRRWTDALWARDLVRHADYLSHFSLACPCFDEDPPPDCVQVDHPGIRFVDLPSRHKASLALPRMIGRLWRSVGEAEVVHTGLGGWLPVSVCNLTLAIARLRRRYLFVMVESSAWRLVPGQPASWLARLQAALAEWTNRRSMARVDLAVFTQRQYLDTLMPGRPGVGHVIHASWIDAADIVSESQAVADWFAKRPEASPRVRLLFAGRLTAAKGVPILLEALRRLDRPDQPIELHIIGGGELLQSCREAAAALQHVRLVLLEPVPYGRPFFELLRRYHALVVPSVTDEQPRIVYDAYSQAVPVLACDTPGLRDCVDEGVNGLLCRPNDAGALAELIAAAAAEPHRLQTLGLAALRQARQMTHQEMHRRRWALLRERLPQRR